MLLLYEEQLTESSAAANLGRAEPRKGHGKGCNVGGDIADDHHIGWVRGDKFGSHDVLFSLGCVRGG